MQNKFRVFKISFSIIAMVSMLSGCGEGKEDNVPAIKLTAAAIVSEPAINGHGHNVEIPFTDISATPGSDVFQYRSSDNTGHSHVIALSKQQMVDLNNGMQITVTSSAASSGVAHTHIWKLLGGNVLYDKNCYNCHSNDKRGRNPMNVTFTSSQTSAVVSPSTAPQSVSPSATPDPGFATPSASALPDGSALYASNCSSCHGALTSSTKSNRSFTQIKNAITNNSGGMASLGALTEAQLQAIAAALIK